jgi:hypothetical protein
MTQAYRCDETAIENQNDSKFSLEKETHFFHENFSACDSRRSPSSVDGATKISRLAAASGDANIDHAKRTTRNASCVDNVFRTRKRFPLRESVYGDACFDCMT